MIKGGHISHASVSVVLNNDFMSDLALQKNAISERATDSQADSRRSNIRGLFFGCPFQLSVIRCLLEFVVGIEAFLFAPKPKYFYKK